MRRRFVIQDSLFLICICLCSVIFYISGLGFYSDDWDYLGLMATSEDQSLEGLFRSIYTPNQYYRPVQILYWAILFWTFGPNATACHIVNAMVLGLTAVVFYRTLLKLQISRYLAVMIPLLFTIIPNYSTVRLWFAAYENILSVLLYLISLYSDLKALESSDYRAKIWKALSLFCLTCSLLAYEVILPLFFLNMVIVWFYSKKHSSLRWFSLPWSNLVLLLMIVFVKALTPQRTGSNSLIHAAFIAKQLLKPEYGPFEYGLNPIQAIKLNFGYYIAGLPYVVIKIFRHYSSAISVMIAALGGTAAFLYMLNLLKGDHGIRFHRKEFLLITAAGVFIFALGYSIFVTNSNVQFTLAGIGNRTAVAASIGVAILWTGLIGLISTSVRSAGNQRILVCLLTAFVCFSGILINNTIASFWIKAYQKQTAVLDDIRRQFPAVPPGTVILIDGVCPYEGPAVVFESRWDLAGALKMMYGHHDVAGDIVTPKLSIEKEGLSTVLYGRIFYTLYPYGKDLWIYNLALQETFQIKDIQTARRYFHNYNRDFNSDCPPGHEGHGVAIF